jgi:hypothetical protein
MEEGEGHQKTTIDKGNESPIIPKNLSVREED